jgi:translation initiation factor IF-3
MKKQCANEQIKEREVKLVMSDGSMRGLVPTHLALSIAKDSELDLVQVSPAKGNNPAICKLMDLGKIKYNSSRNKKHQHKDVTKEIKVGFNISEHDMGTKSKQIAKFLSKKYKVRFTLELRGRYKYMKDLASAKMDSHLKSFEEVAQWDDIKENNNNFSVMLKPLGK